MQLKIHDQSSDNSILFHKLQPIINLNVKQIIQYNTNQSVIDAFK